MRVLVALDSVEGRLPLLNMAGLCMKDVDRWNHKPVVMNASALAIALV